MQKWLMAITIAGMTHYGQAAEQKTSLFAGVADWLLTQRIKDGDLPGGPEEQVSQLVLGCDDYLSSQSVFTHRLGVLTRPCMMVILNVKTAEDSDLRVLFAFYRSASTGLLSGFLDGQKQERIFNDVNEAVGWIWQEIKESLAAEQKELLKPGPMIKMGVFALRGDRVPMGLLYAATEFGFR